MPILDHWQFSTLSGTPERLSGEEIVLIEHPATGLALLVMVPDYDGRRAAVALHDPARDVVMVTGGAMLEMSARVGGCEVRSGPHSSNRVTFVPGGMHFELHHRRDSSMLVALILPAGRLAAMAAAAGWTMPTPFLLHDDAALAALVYQTNRLIMRLCEKDIPAIEALTARLAAALAAIPAARTPPQRPRIALPPHKLRSVLAFVDDNLGRPLTLHEMADQAGLSPYHFARMFKQQTGRSPYDHVRWRRIVRSTALVARSELGIAEISASTGFASTAHFSQAFHQAAGLSPSRFRRLVRPRLLANRTDETAGAL